MDQNICLSDLQMSKATSSQQLNLATDDNEICRQKQIDDNRESPASARARKISAGIGFSRRCGVIIASSLVVMLKIFALSSRLVGKELRFHVDVGVLKLLFFWLSFKL